MGISSNANPPLFSGWHAYGSPIPISSVLKFRAKLKIEL
jgi:hypothetical protein